jgi:hypothetical protein
MKAALTKKMKLVTAHPISFETRENHLRDKISRNE